MSNSGKKDRNEAIAKINDIGEMLDIMKTFGIDTKGLATLEQMKTRTQEKLAEMFPQDLPEVKGKV